MYFCFFFFKQKTAYEMRISDWSSDVCSSDLSTPGKMQLYTRNLNEVHSRYPELSRLNRALHHHSAILDGELVAFVDGKPSFEALQQRMHVDSERSEARRVGKECVSTCRSRWSPLH